VSNALILVRFCLDKPNEINKIEVILIINEILPSFNDVINVTRKRADTVTNPILPIVRQISLKSFVIPTHLPGSSKLHLYSAPNLI